MKQIILTVGLPASGKTTWATQFVQRRNNYGGAVKWINTNRDDIRRMLQGVNKHDRHLEDVVTGLQVAAAEQFLKMPHSEGVVVSDTNLNPKVRDRWKRHASNLGAEYSENRTFTFHSPDICIANDTNREHKVGEQVIRRMFENFRSEFPETFTTPPQTYQHIPPSVEVRRYINDPSLRSVFIFDIDGTLANMNGHRTAYEYHKCDQDVPYDDVLMMAHILHFAGYDLIFVSGREGTAECRQKTSEWLHKHQLYGRLLMRPEGDMRKDSVVKREILFNEIAPFYNVLGAFDDRSQVVDMWRDIGVRCYDVAGHKF